MLEIVEIGSDCIGRVISLQLEITGELIQPD
jgi:hypothetical protein